MRGIILLLLGNRPGSRHTEQTRPRRGARRSLRAWALRTTGAPRPAPAAVTVRAVRTVTAVTVTAGTRRVLSPRAPPLPSDVTERRPLRRVEGERCAHARRGAGAGAGRPGLGRGGGGPALLLPGAAFASPRRVRGCGGLLNFCLVRRAGGALTEEREENVFTFLPLKSFLQNTVITSVDYFCIMMCLMRLLQEIMH